MSEIQVTVTRERRGEPELVVDGDRVHLTGGVAARIEVPEGVAVTAQEAFGDLKVSRFTGDLRIRNVYGDLQVKNTTGRIEIEQINGDVRAEDVASMQVLDCEADLRFSGGDLHAEVIHGDMRVTDAGSVRVRHVHGDMWLERLTGGVQVEATHGDARLSQVEGAAVLGIVAGDFRASVVQGPLTASQVHGDAQLEGPFPAPEGYAVSALGDAHIRLAAEDDVRLTVRAMGRVRSSLPLTPSADGSTTYTATLGEGKVRIALTANGDLRIEAAGGGREDVRGPGERRRATGTDSFADLSDLGERIRQQVTASLAAAGINPETGEININMGRGRGGRGRPPEKPEPPERPRPPRSATPHDGPQAAGQAGGGMTSEQRAVLKMLEEGRISPEEADALLRALGA
jgi:hypothetical protein